jgi:hypothetical protein
MNVSDGASSALAKQRKERVRRVEATSGGEEIAKGCRISDGSHDGQPRPERARYGA